MTKNVTAVEKATRGKCNECGYRFRLRADGTMQAHWIYGAPGGAPYSQTRGATLGFYCAGGGKPPRDE